MRLNVVVLPGSVRSDRVGSAAQTSPAQVAFSYDGDTVIVTAMSHDGRYLYARVANLSRSRCSASTPMGLSRRCRR